MRSFIVTLAIVLLAGCSSPKQMGQPGSDPSSSTATMTPTNSIAPETPGPLANETFSGMRLDGTNCNGVALDFEALPQLYNVSRPGDWPPHADETPTGAVMYLYYRLFLCDRLAWDGFERGPVWILLEEHSNFSSPMACREGDHTTAVFLQHLWISDQELVDHAVTAYNMPASFAEFEVTTEKQGPVLQPKWTFGLPGGPRSMVVHPDVEGNFIGHGDMIVRIYWVDGEGASFVDFGEEYNRPQVGPADAWGRLESPLLYGATMPDPTFVTERAELFTNVTVAAPIHRFWDTQCTQPR